MPTFLEFPLLKRELRALLRTRRAFWLLIVSVVLSTLLPLLAWPSDSDAAFGSSYLARMVFIVFGLTQLSVALLIVPAFTSGAIAGEREADTYELLYTTLLSPVAIIISKVLASTTYIVILLVATAPCLVVMNLLGGLEFQSVALSFLVIFAAVLSSALICLTVSMRSTRTAPAAVRGFFWVVFWNGGLTLLLLLGALVADQMFRFNEDDFIGVVAITTTPYVAIFSTLEEMGFFGVNFPIPPVFAYLAYASALSVFHFLYMLRAVRMPGVTRRGRKERALAAAPMAVKKRARARRKSILVRVLAAPMDGLSVRGNPIFQKELITEFFGKLWFRRTVFWASFVILGLIAIGIGWDDGLLLGIWLPASIALTLFLPGIVASSIPREIEQGSFDHVRGTLLRFGQIYRGKLSAGLLSLSGIFFAACWMTVIVLALGGFGGRSFGRIFDHDDASLVFRGAGFILFLGVGVVFGGLVAGFFGALCRKVLSALAGTYLTLVAIYIVIPVFLGFLMAMGGGDEGAAKFLCSLNPYASAVSILFAPSDWAIPVFVLGALWYSIAMALAIGLGGRVFIERKYRDR